MKKLLVVMLCLVTYSSFALTLNAVMSQLPKAIEVQSGLVNLDGSVTFEGIEVKRGDLTFKISAMSEYSYVCKMLGYENLLTGFKHNSISKVSLTRESMVMITSEGEYRHMTENTYFISKVTCFNGSLKRVVDFDMVKNEDGSYKITNITYKRGDQTYFIAALNEYDNVCKMLGFEESLSGYGLNEIKSNFSKRTPNVILNDKGEYTRMEESTTILSKVTCYSGEEPKLIILVDGKRYRKD